MLLVRCQREDVNGVRKAMMEGFEREAEDVRTLAAKWNRTGERYRSWDSVCEHLEDQSFTDWPMTGPRTTSWPALHMLKDGGSPSAYLNWGVRNLKLSESDRSAHELELLLNVVALAGSTDQLSFSNLS